MDFSGAEIVFGQALRQMAQLTELPLKTVIRAEAGSVLKECAGRTKVALPGRVGPNARRKLIRALGLNAGDVVISSGVRKPEAAGTIRAVSHGRRSTGYHRKAYGPGDPTGEPENTHFMAADWVDIQEAKFDYVRKVGHAVAAALRAIGLSRQSWIQIADDMGIRLENVPGGRLSVAGIEKARNAMASDGQTHRNGYALQVETAESFYVDLVNRLPAGANIGFAAILYAAIRGRERRFEILMQKGVFDSMQKVAQEYPGFYVNQGTN